MAVQNVNMFSPYLAEQTEIERRRRIAEALQMQGMQPIEIPQTPAGGFAVPISPMQGLAKIAQSLMGGYGQRKSAEETKGLTDRYRAQSANEMDRFMLTAKGTPAVQPTFAVDDEGNPMPSYPAVPGNLDAAYAGLANSLDPARANLALTRGMSQMERQQQAEEFRALINELNGGQGSRQPVVDALRQGADIGDIGPTNTNAERVGQSGNPLAGIDPSVIALMGSPNPLAQKLAPMLQKTREPINVRPEGTVYMPGQGPIFTAPKGGIQTRWGSAGPSASSVPGYAPALAGVETAQAAGKAYGALPYAPPSAVNVPGAPVGMTPSQQIQSATGLPPPTPAQVLSGTRPIPKVSVAPTVTLSEIQRITDPAERAQAEQAFRQQRGAGIPLQSEGEQAEQKKIGSELGDFYGKSMISAANAGVSNRFIDNMEKAAAELKTGKLGPAQSELIQWAQAIGVPISKEERNMAGSFQALNSLAINLAGKATRQSDAQPAAFQYLQVLKSMPDIIRTPEGFSRITAWMRDMNNYEIAKFSELSKWRQQRGTSEGFQEHWAQAQTQLPFVWNQRFGVDEAIQNAPGQPGRQGVVTPATRTQKAIPWDQLR